VLTLRLLFAVQICEAFGDLRPSLTQRMTLSTNVWSSEGRPHIVSKSTLYAGQIELFMKVLPCGLGRGTWKGAQGAALSGSGCQRAYHGSTRPHMLRYIGKWFKDLMVMAIVVMVNDGGVFGVNVCAQRQALRTRR
jgi:hypothetical protein